jgi:hypothetical protein
MSKNYNITAIALQEMWSVLHPELVNIDGFTLVCKTRGGGRGVVSASIFEAILSIRLPTNSLSFWKMNSNHLQLKLPLAIKKSFLVITVNHPRQTKKIS